MDGIDSVELFIGEADSMTGWHVEDLNLGSVNFHVSGKPKMWVEYVSCSITNWTNSLIINQKNFIFQVILQAPEEGNGSRGKEIP
jgi:hypothetical protein